MRIPRCTRVNVLQMMAGCMVLASFVAQVRGVKFYGFERAGARRGQRVVLQRQPHNAYDNCVEVRLLPGRQLLGHLEAALATLLSPLMRDVSVDVAG